jgi:protein O-mannosyl-transferase
MHGKAKPPAKQNKAGKQAVAAAAGKKPGISLQKKPFAPGKRIGWFLFVLALLLYAQSLWYDFTLDDRIVIFENSLTTQGIQAIPEIFATPYLYGSVIPDDMIYRPVSKAIFALCWSLAPESPGIFHFCNILFYALTGLMLFLTLSRYFPRNIYVPVIATLLFITHPIHTEVINNVKSLDEILCLLFCIISLYLLHGYLNSKRIIYLVAAALSFFLSFLSKESGAAFLLIFPLAAYFAGGKKPEILKISAAMLAVTGIVFLIRILVLGAFNMNPPLPADNILAGTDNFWIQRVTAITLAGKYLLLLLFPHPLVCDYSPQQVSLIGAGDWRFILSLLVYLALLAFAALRFVKKDWISFSILFFLIAFSTTSNLLFLGGTHFAERFMYAPSVGFALAVALLADRFINRKAGQQPGNIRDFFFSRPLLMAAALIVSAIFASKTLMQNPVCKNNISLFEHGIIHSPKSFRMYVALAANLTAEKNLQQFDGETQQRLRARAISLIKTGLSFRQYPAGYNMLGNEFYLLRQYDSAFHYYSRGLHLEPENTELNHHAAKALNKLQRYQEAIGLLNIAYAKEPQNDGVLFNLGLSHTNLGNADTGLAFFLKITQLKPERADAWHYAGLILQAKGETEKGKEYLEKAAALGWKQE